MKPPRYNKVLGLSLGEQSLLAAEVHAGDKPAVKRMAEFVYPAGVTLNDPAALGKALGEFLRSKQFTAKHAIVGLPAKWLVVKPKDVPATDPATLANILRLQVEGEFSADLKELMYDYAGDGGTSVMLIATPRKHVDSATALGQAAGLSVIAVTPSAVALGSATSRAMSANAMVLATGTGGSEFTAQHGTTPVALRQLRSASTGELRRAISTVPSNGSPRELVLWDSDGMDAASLSQGLGFAVRKGELAALGVDASVSPDAGPARKFAPAVAVALASLSDQPLAIDFLHSRLAAPKKTLVPRWALYTAAGVLLAVLISAWLYNDLQRQQRDLAADKAKLAQMKPQIDSADAFVSKVSFARGWQSTEPRYVACVKDITAALPNDDATYATSLLVRELTTIAKGGKVVNTGQLAGTMYGKTTDQQHVLGVIDGLKQNPAFSDVKPGGTQDAGRGREVSFSITFVYRPGKG